MKDFECAECAYFRTGKCKQNYEICGNKGKAIAFEIGRFESIDELINQLEKIDDCEFAMFSLAKIKEVAVMVKGGEC